MSYAVLPDKVIAALSNLSFTAIAVVVSIASFMDKQAKGCFPGLKTIMARIGLKSTRAARKAIRELCEAGVLSIQERTGQSHIYSWSKVKKGITENTQMIDRPPGTSSPPTPVPEGREGRVPPVPPKETKKDTKKDSIDHPDRPDLHQEDVWGWWLMANKEVGRRLPVSNPRDKKAGKLLWEMIENGDLLETELFECMVAYLSDRDRWLIEQGHPLRILPDRLNSYLNNISEDNQAFENYADSNYEESIDSQDQDK